MSRIMILDDSAFVLNHAAATLTKAGYEVETAEDWIGVRRILGAYDSIDLVLLDVNLPGLQDGNNLALSLSRHPTTRDAKLVLFSGKSAKELARLSARTSAIDGYIEKGRTPGGFVRDVAAFIGPPRG